MRILGIDPGTRLTGYGVIDFHPANPALVDAGVIRLDADADIARRLVELERELAELIAEHRPDVCAVEQLYAHYNHPRTSIIMGHARGVILLCAARANVHVRELSPNRVKQSLIGHG
ncbi:MAG: crossover junction endodeoxyribonuclease RuvC, partial [Planctomycetota bacterium]